MHHCRIYFFKGLLKLILLPLFIFSEVYAQGSSETGMAFLKHGYGARNIAMGDLGIVGVNDLSALNYNPSMLAVVNKTQLSFSHNSLFQDLSSELLAGSFSLIGLPIAIGVNTTNISNIEIRTKPGEAEGSFNAHYFSGSVSSGFQITRNILIGGTLKYLYENFYTDESNGYSLDFGATYINLLERLDAAIVVRNIGSMSALRNVSSKLPTDIQLGFSYNFLFSDFNLQPVAGFQKYFNQDESQLHLGVEVLYKESFALRTGYITGFDSKNLTTGFGIKWKGFNIDYAYVPVKYGLGDSHILTLIYTFN
jgi:hypothetical protein